MAVWGVDSGSCAENILSSLGLISYGGRILNNKSTYIIYSKSKNNKFKFEIECDKLRNNVDNIKKAYQPYLRKEKLLKINNINDRI